MSIKVMTRVWEHSKAKGSELLLLLAIADHANDEGFAWPSINSLAAKTRLGRRQTQILIQKLITDEDDQPAELAVRANAGPRGVNIYEVLVGTEPLPPHPDDIADEAPRGAPQFTGAKIAPVNPSARGGAPRRTTPANHSAHEPSVEPSREPSREGENSSQKEVVNDWTHDRSGDPRFREWYVAHPHANQEMMAAASVEWRGRCKNMTDQEFADAMYVLEVQKRSRRYSEQNYRYLPFPIKYLQQGWMTNLPMEPPPAPASKGEERITNIFKNIKQETDTPDDDAIDTTGKALP